MRIALPLAILVAFGAAACSGRVLQESADGRVQVTDRKLRMAFDQFCRSSEAEGRCGDYGEYAYDDISQIGVDGVGVWFLYQPALEDPHLRTDRLLSLGCWWRHSGVECHSGEHAY
jgi:hypothetical protein